MSVHPYIITLVSTQEFLGLIEKAEEYKELYRDPTNRPNAPKPLVGDVCSMIFQKRSTRTR
jgi:ornithine carbamoyltransferase